MGWSTFCTNYSHGILGYTRKDIKYSKEEGEETSVLDKIHI
jgi:hypothetical protein